MVRCQPNHKYLNGGKVDDCGVFLFSSVLLTHVAESGFVAEFIDGDQRDAQDCVRSRRRFVQMRFRCCTISKPESNDLLGFMTIKNRNSDEVFDDRRMLILHQTKMFAQFHLFGLDEEIEDVFVVQFKEGNPN